MKRILLSLFSTLCLAVIVITLTSHASSITGYSGGCSCHGTTASSTNLYLTGLPANVIAGQQYPISITIATTGGKKWGFDMTVPAGSGTFTTTNANAAVTSTGLEVHHINAPSSTAASYTFSNIIWTAPTTAGTVTFKYAGVGATSTSGSSANGYKSTFTTTVSVPTPLHLISFSAKADGTNAVLNWVTDNEVNTSHFSIEKSVDGVVYVEIGVVNAKGNTTTQSNYSFVDTKPTAFNKPVYYRLKMVDNDGSAKYSNIVSITLKNTKPFDLSVYPNPTKLGETIKLKLNATAEAQAKIILIGYNGKIVSNKSIQLINGSNLIDLNTKFVSAGNYIFLVNIGNEMMQVPVIIE